jgi:exopolysaccharide production protein ExoQ
MQPSKSIAAQLGTIAVLLFSMGAFAAFENLDQAGDSRFQAAWAVIYILFAVAFVPWRKAMVHAALAQKWLLVLVAWTLLSTLWSADPALTLRRAGALACTTALGIYLGVRFTQRQMLHLLAIALAVAVLASAVVAIALPSVGVMQGLYAGSWRGIFSHKNTLARTAVLSIVAFGCVFAAEPKRRKLGALAIMLVLPELLFSKSATGFLSVVILASVALSFWMFRALSRSLLLPTAYWAGGIAVALGCWLFAHSPSAFALIGRDPTLTGRTDLWAFAVDAMGQRPWLGYGFDAFWLGPGGDAIRTAVRWDAPHSHNGFLDLSLDVGLIGTTLFLIGLAIALRRAFAYTLQAQDPFRLWPVLYLTVFLLCNLTETTTVVGNSLEWLLYVSICVSLCPQPQLGFETGQTYSPPHRLSPSTLAP